MLIKSKNNINYMVDSRMELLFGIHSAFQRIEPNENLDWVESPAIPYVDEVIELIKIQNHPELCNYIKYAWDSCDDIPNIALAFDEEFNLCEDKLNARIKEFFQYGDIYSFSKLIKDLAVELNWEHFLQSKKNFFEKLLNDIISFPDNLDINDIITYYGYAKSSYNYVISVLINGGFGIESNSNDLYCIRGFQFDEDEKKFIVNKDYLLENLFHEFSHPYVNPIIDKYFSYFTNVKEFQEEALKHNLFKTYSKYPKTLFYEYFVRANAKYLSSKYSGNMQIAEGVLKHGFIHLKELTNFISKHKASYPTFEDLFINELVSYINDIGNKKNEHKLQISKND